MIRSVNVYGASGISFLGVNNHSPVFLNWFYNSPRARTAITFCLPGITLKQAGNAKTNAIRIDKREFGVNGDIAIHAPAGAKSFAEPDGTDLANRDWGSRRRAV